MLSQNKPASILNNSKDLSQPASYIGTDQDRLDNYNGIHQMFIGYLLNCNREGNEVSDVVHSAFINIASSLNNVNSIPVKQSDTDMMTVSEYAKQKGFNGFNGNLASRLSRKAAKLTPKTGLNSLGVKKYPVSVLDSIFTNL